MRYLDQFGDASVPVNYSVAQSESEFLELAFSDNVVVQGDELCSWASVFWHCRKFPHELLESPIQKLRHYVPGIAEEDARAILSLDTNAGKIILGSKDLRSLLKGLFPSDIWQISANLHHGAHWLLWLDEVDPPNCVQGLLKLQAGLWEQQLEGVTRLLYQQCDAGSAKVFLRQWLRLEAPVGEIERLEEFPVPLPDRLLSEIDEIWTKRVVESRGLYFRSLLNCPLSFGLKQRAVRLCVDYFRRHPSSLNEAIIAELSDFLSMEEMRTLREIVPPMEPPVPPSDVDSLVSWFCNLYLPYRLWAIDRNLEKIDEICRSRSVALAKWFLGFYPTALAAGAETISFRRCGRIMCDRTDEVTLLIILDGIGIWDGKELVRQIKGLQRRLTLVTDGWCFAGIPTVTEICKPAMRQGVAPRNVNPGAYTLASD